MKDEGTRREAHYAMPMFTEQQGIARNASILLHGELHGDRCSIASGRSADASRSL
jgi:hypothetical protein